MASLLFKVTRTLFVRPAKAGDQVCYQGKRKPGSRMRGNMTLAQKLYTAKMTFDSRAVPWKSLQHFIQQLLHRLGIEKTNHLMLTSGGAFAVRQNFILRNIDAHGVRRFDFLEVHH